MPGKRLIIDSIGQTTALEDLTPAEEADRSAVAQQTAAAATRAAATQTAKAQLKTRAKASGPLTTADLRLVILAMGDDPDS